MSSEEIKKLPETLMFDLFKKILDNPYLAEEEDSSYYNSVFESIKSFENLENETYVALKRRD
jgi:hypothetical protein